MPLNALHCSVMVLSAVCAALHAPVRPALRAAAPAPVKHTIKRINQNTIEVQGVRIKGTAYVRRNDKASEASRYDVEVLRRPSDGTQWHLTDALFGLDLDWPRPMSGFYGESSAVPYRKQQRIAQVSCELRQVDTREERVTFHNLDIKRDIGLGFLTITQAQTATTPDGVTVTLPAQNMQTFMSGDCFCYNGPSDVVFIRVLLSPGGRRRVLPASALYQRYKVPVNLYVRAAAPVFTNSYPEDNPVQDIHITTPDKQATHLDTLTLIIRQVADLQTIPLKFDVPIDRSRHE